MKAVIFDMDGVVQDTEDLHHDIEFNLIKKYGGEVKPGDWDQFIGRKAVDIFTKVIQMYNLKDITPEQMMFEKREEYLRRAEKEVKLMPGFTELVQFLKQHYKLGLATSAVAMTQEYSFNKFNLDPIFDAVVNCDMVTNSKPDPEPYALTIKKLGLNPEDCVVIEDAENGLISAKAAGAHTIGFTSSLPAEKLTHADIICHNLKEVQELFEKGWPF